MEAWMRRWKTWFGTVRAIAVAAVLVGLFVPAARAQQAPLTGSVQGRVVDAATGDLLAGAQVTVAGAGLETATDRDGRFRLPSVPSGTRTIVVSFLGRAARTADVDVPAGGVASVDVELLPTVFSESVQVTSDLQREAQARALSQQKTAPNITNIVSADQIGSFPDANAAETTQRIPGISITKDQGEGRYVNIRGTDARLNAMTINGERIPSPDPLLRQVALDVVPAELLQAIEVSKALTPDMDADSIGGAVNLVMKAVPERFRVVGAIAGGYNDMLKSTNQNMFSLTAGRRLAGGRLGAVGSLSRSDIRRGNQDMEVVYTPAFLLNELNPRYYQVRRGRFGATGAVDFRAGDSTSFTVRSVFNRFIDDHENRQRVRWAVANSRIDRELRDRTHIQRIGSFSVSGQTIARGATTVDYQLLGAYSDQFDPLTMTTTFRATRVTFAPNVTGTSIDPDNIQANPQNDSPANYTLLQQIRATNFSKDRDIVGSVNARVPLGASGDALSFIKAGLKYRDKAKGRNRNESVYTTTSTVRMTDYLETDFDLRPFLDGRYDLQPYLKQSLVEGIPSQVPVSIARNRDRDAEEFDGTERVAAAYAMAEFYRGRTLLILPGVRFEYTAADFTGRDVRYSPAPRTWRGSDPLPASASYGIVLPSLHVRYGLSEDANLRVAVTRSLARPNYYDIVPYRVQDDTASTIALGNADLKPTSSYNVDVMAERYFRSVGVLSGGFFYKNLSNYIFTFTETETLAGTQYRVTQPQNGDRATVRGLEAAFQNRLTFLPRPLDGIGVYANYTRTESSAQLPGRDGRSRLPGQSKHAGNLAVSYEKRGFSGRLAVNFHGSYVDAVGASSAFDRYYDTNSQADLSLSQRLTRNIQAFANLMNLNDALLRYYQGVPERVLQEEHYRWWASFGLRVNF
jgi:TonB-dependent receptor